MLLIAFDLAEQYEALIDLARTLALLSFTASFPPLPLIHTLLLSSLSFTPSSSPPSHPYPPSLPSLSFTPSSASPLIHRYVALLEQHPPPGGNDALLSHAVFHLRRLCRTPLTEYDMLAELKACTSLAACAAVVQRCRAYAEGALAFEGRVRPPSYWRRQQRRGRM